MIKFIKYFIFEWNRYTDFKAWRSIQPKDLIERLEATDRASGIEPYKNRFDFAFRNAVIYCKGKE